MDAVADEKSRFPGSDTSELDYHQCTRLLTFVLRLLWNLAIKEISDKLGFTGPAEYSFEQCVHSIGKHVTWIRTGHLNRLPVHTAMDENGYPFIECACNSFISSFQALAFAKLDRKIV